jgi:excisionase family DNA binding protein
MQFERTQIYRVKVVANTLDVSVATIYRAVESGALRAHRLGTGKGAVRIPGDALLDYIAACERAAMKDRATEAANNSDTANLGGVA